MIEVGDPLGIAPLTTVDSTGTAADATAVTLTVTLPDGVTTLTPTISHVAATGLYTVQTQPLATVVGEHRVFWSATGTNGKSQRESIVVTEQPFGIVTLAKVKNRLRISRTTDDDMLQDLIATASDICESAEGTNRVWRRTVVTNEIHSGGERFIVPFKRPILSLTSVTVDGVSQTIADLDVESWRITNPLGTIGTSYRSSTALISYVAGAPAGTIPEDIQTAVVELVRHLYAPMRGGSNLPRQEEPDYTESAGYLIPNRVAMIFRAHQAGF
jgi:uncharacterized phiE125 gp8 family phage protein